MRRLLGQSFQWVFILTGAILTGSVLLRAVVKYSTTSQFGEIVALLMAWLALAVSESFISRRLRHYFPFYLTVETALVFVLFFMPGFPDFFATLLMVQGMQVMLRLRIRIGALWIGLCAVLMVLVLFQNANYRAQAVGLSLVNLAGIVLFASFVIANLRSRDTRIKNESLAKELQAANDSLGAFSAQLKQVALAGERNRLAREMHDSITQTVFSMSLAAQSAEMMLGGNPKGAEAQLKRLEQLSQSALDEIKVLVSDLRPALIPGGLAPALRSFIDGHHFAGSLKVELHVDGDKSLDPQEDQVLFRIARESLNNAAKHSHADKVEVRLNLKETPSLEIEDRGQGFDLEKARSGTGVGLKSMAEQASEIGWNMAVISAPGSGTLIRVQKKAAQGGRL